MNYMHPKIDNPNAEDFAVPIDSELLAGLKNYVADYGNPCPKLEK